MPISSFANYLIAVGLCPWLFRRTNRIQTVKNWRTTCTSGLAPTARRSIK